MSALKTIIVDDEKLARRGLALRLKDIPQVEIIAECANGPDALKAIAEHAPDLVFLDIQMPGMNGFEMVCELQADIMPMIVFVTAFDQYAVEAFKIHAVDYMLKPIEAERLREAVERAVSRHAQRDSTDIKEQLMELMQGMPGTDVGQPVVQDKAPSQSWPERLTIKDGSDFQFVKIADIQWVDAAGDYMCVHAGGKTHIMRTTMKQLEATLNPDTFLRVHRSSIVNANYIAGAQTCCEDGQERCLAHLIGGAHDKVGNGDVDEVTAIHEVRRLLPRVRHVGAQYNATPTTASFWGKAVCHS
jgi:two-component system LytT family response regulator